MNFYNGYTPRRDGSRPTDSSHSRMDVDDDLRNSRRSPQRAGPRTRQHDDPMAPHMRGHSDYGHSGYHGHQMVTQERSFRSKEASTQMLYEVFANVVSVLEEFEARENSKDRQSRSLPRSDIYLPDQSRKKDEDIKRILETQLLIFETHLHSACRPEIRMEVIPEFAEAAKKWIAVRNDRKLKRGRTDEYAAQLYEIITRGKTYHPSVFRESPHIDERNLQVAARQYFEGDHRRAQLDQDFARNPSKKASMPAFRSGSSSESGLNRIFDQRPDLVQDPTSLK